MQVPLFFGAQPHGDEMGIRIAAEKKYLEKQKTRRPDRRRASEPGQKVFSNQQLDLKQKESADEHGCTDSVRVRKGGGFLIRGRNYNAVSGDSHVRQCVMNLARHAIPTPKVSRRRSSLNFMHFVPCLTETIPGCAAKQ